MVGRRKSEKVVKQLGSRLIHRARMFELRDVRLRAPDGREFHHQVVFHPGAAVMVPVLSGERFVLLKQYRTAARGYIWEFPAGTLEKGEAPLACAKREIIEETGYRAKRWRKLASFFPAPGVSTEFMHLYLATDLVLDVRALEQDEFIEHEIISFSRLQKMILSGIIVDAKTIIGFFYYCFRRKNKFS